MAKAKVKRNKKVIAFYNAGKSPKDIAKRIGITEGGVKGLLSRLADKGLIVRNRRQRTKEPENWKKGRTQVSVWLADGLAEEVKVKAIREKQALSDLVADLLQKGLKK